MTHTDQHKLVHVDLVDNLRDRSYPIHIGGGLLSQAGDILAAHFKRPHFVVVTDDHVAPLYLDKLETGLKAQYGANVFFKAIILPAGESTKSFANLEFLLGGLLDAGVERQDCIIALGGGVIGDLTGFAASILRRGCKFIQIPTTLLAQVDSSVGGKTAINHAAGKNLIGAFHQPEAVLIDIDVLNTLPMRELKAGYAEVIKYGLINDAAFFDWCCENGTALLAGDHELRQHAIVKSVTAKADIVARDETEQNLRALLNFGHTFGHALEAEMGFDGRLLHGEAVAIGCVMALAYSAQQGLCDPLAADKFAAHLNDIGMMKSAMDIDGLMTDADQLLARCYQDKKVQSGALTFVLAHGIGAAFIEKNVDPTSLKTFFESQLA